jgi:hypothetical protein
MVLKKKMNLITNKELLNQKSEDPFMFGASDRYKKDMEGRQYGTSSKETLTQMVMVFLVLIFKEKINKIIINQNKKKE